MKRYALIPAYQPDETLVRFSHQLEHQGFEVVLVDDGSDAPCAELFRQAEAAVVLRHNMNRGKGAALRTGLQWLKEHGEGPFVVVTADADGQHLAPDVLRVAEEAQRHPDSLVLGARAFEGDVPLRSRIGNGLTRLIFRFSAGTWVGDTQTGLRGFREGQLDFLLSVAGERYEYEMNVLLEAARRGVPLRELRVETVYQPGNPTSHFRTLRDSGRILGEVLRFSAASLVSFGVDFGLFCLFSALTGLVAVSNVLARLISAGVNFTLNRRLVFQKQGEWQKQAQRYVLLAAGILLCNTLILKALTMGGLAAPGAKLLTELGLFACSYAVQRRFVFAKGEERPNPLKNLQKKEKFS
jgi:glycosyltransferase involved in cell wall biosynthesis